VRGIEEDAVAEIACVLDLEPVARPEGREPVREPLPDGVAPVEGAALQEPPALTISTTSSAEWAIARAKSRSFVAAN
jgi:hypothetical protein